MRGNKYLALLGFVLAASMLVTGARAELEISDCAELNETGMTYLLTADIVDSNATTCMNITANNITFDCQGYTIDGQKSVDSSGIYGQANDTVIQNCNVGDWWRGVNIYDGRNILIRNNIISTSDNALKLTGGINVTVEYNEMSCIGCMGFGWAPSGIRTYSPSLKNSTIRHNYINDTFIGIMFDVGATGNTVWNNTMENHNYGIILMSASDSNIYGNTMRNAKMVTPRDGLYIANSSGIFYNNTFEGARYGIRFINSSNVFFWNSLINGTVFTDCSGGCLNNSWNTTRQAGTRIYSDGTDIGGNYWTNSTSNGYSDTCTDSNADGFCDSPYTLAENNIDYLALSDEFAPPPIEISDCAVLDQTGTTYLLTADITDSAAATCMDITANSVTLDCQGHVIDGTGTGSGIMVSDKNDTIIQNCSVNDWNRNIYVRDNSRNTLVRNNIISSSAETALRLEGDINTTAEYNEIYGATFGVWTCCPPATDFTIRHNHIYDAYIAIGLGEGTTGSTVWNNTIDNCNFGFLVMSASDSSIYGNTVRNANTATPKDGLNMEFSNRMNIYDNVFEGARYGLKFVNSSDVSFHNNLINGTVFTKCEEPSTGEYYSDYWGCLNNEWNTTQQAGTRIYSDGTDIGGNYWTNSTSNGYSDTCTDSNTDGFCDEPLTLETNNIDYLALSDQYGATYITATFDYNTVHFGNLAAGSSDTRGGFDVGFYLSVSVDTNAAYKIEASGTDFTDGGGHGFYIGNLKMDAENSFGGLSLGAAVSLTNDEQLITGSWDYTDTTSFHGFWLSIPAAQYAGAYTSTVTITYSNV